MTVVKQNDEYLYTRENGHTERSGMVVAYPPESLLTNQGGPNARIRVDVAQTGFFSGREFRTFRRLNVGAGAGLVIRAVVPVNSILFSLSLELTDGWIDIETVAGGTPGGSFAETLPVFNRNVMTDTPVYAGQNVMTAGGTHTGGTVLDALAVRAAGATAQASSVGNALSDERGIAPGTYYFRLTNPGSGAAVGVFRAWWEERP